MNAYFFKMTNEERNNILDQHKEIYDGYVTSYAQPEKNQPLYTQDYANDKEGVTVNNKGDVSSYKIMENIHILPTDKPSRLYLSDYGKELNLSGYPLRNYTTGKHIYITSDEEIEEGDWCFLDQPLENGFPNHQEVFQNKDDSDYLNMVNHLVKKIILTDNQDLIKDGVQAIDDEFLEWFVKNPSCEEVKVEGHLYKGQDETEYKIIIPKEEPKYTTSNLDNEKYKDYSVSKEEPKEQGHISPGSQYEPEESFESEEDEGHYVSMGEQLDMIGDGDDDLEHGTFEDDEDFEELEDELFNDDDIMALTNPDDSDDDFDLNIIDLFGLEDEVDEGEQDDIISNITESLDMFKRFMKYN
jgi:hypothetical protein